MKSRLTKQLKTASYRIQPALAGPVFPRPSRQLLEGIGWIKPVRRPQALCCFHTQLPRRQKTSKSSSGHNPLRSEALNELDDALRLSRQVLESETPAEDEVLRSLNKCEELARYFKENTSDKTGREEQGQHLLFLEEGDRGTQSESKVAAAIQVTAVQKLSETAYTIIKDPRVFITAKVLEAYVNIQAILGRPESLAEVLGLYATKPIPVQGSNPIQYAPATPNKASSAVPIQVANTALDAAIQARILPLCLDIISSTVCTPAFYRGKIIRRALVPMAAFASAPVAAWALASQFSLFQETMNSQVATNVAFAGILSYVVGTGTIGYVALTTANDQMDRITWADGTPLRYRWLREEERGMMDKVANAWGFAEDSRRGEEVGPEWEALKELVGLRGMVLDRVELMQGME